MSPVPSIRSGQMTSTAFVLLATLAVLMVPQAAFAQAADFTGVQESIGRDFTKIPKAVAVLSPVPPGRGIPSDLAAFRDCDRQYDTFRYEKRFVGQHEGLKYSAAAINCFRKKLKDLY